MLSDSLRVESVHLGDQDGTKGLYHTNHKVANLLQKLNVQEFTKSRTREIRAE